MARHNANSDFFWIALPIPLMALGFAISDVALSMLQFIVIAVFSLALFAVVLRRIEWTTLQMSRTKQNAVVRRQRLFGASRHDLSLSQIAKVRPEVFQHESGSKGFRLLLEAKEAGKTSVAKIPLVSVAKDWDAQTVADDINAWIARYQTKSDCH